MVQRPNETCYYYQTAYLFIDLHVIVTASGNPEEIIIVVENNWNKLWDVLDEMARMEEKGW